MPNSTRPPRDDVERLHAAGRDERMAQAEVVDVRAEPERSVPRREEREVGERVEHRRVGGTGGCVLARVRRAAHLRREHEVLGQPDRLVAEPLGLERRVEVEVRVERAERDPNFTSCSPVAVAVV